MRVSQQVKQQTRRDILDAARDLFRNEGFESATTRDLATAAGIAAGTLFNYFPTKEAVLVEMAVDDLVAVHAKRAKLSPDAQTLDEALFSLVAACLRRLRPLRKSLHHALPLLTSPLSEVTAATALRQQHLDLVVQWSRQYKQPEPQDMELQIYWALWAGVWNHWVADSSPHQEDSLAFLDQTMQMFVHWLSAEQDT